MNTSSHASVPEVWPYVRSQSVFANASKLGGCAEVARQNRPSAMRTAPPTHTRRPPTGAQERTPTQNYKQPAAKICELWLPQQTALACPDKRLGNTTLPKEQNMARNEELPWRDASHMVGSPAGCKQNLRTLAFMRFVTARPNEPHATSKRHPEIHPAFLWNTAGLTHAPTHNVTCNCARRMRYEGHTALWKQPPTRVLSSTMKAKKLTFLCGGQVARHLEIP